jgi:hypothetical protein
MIHGAMPKLHAELQAAVDRFVAASERVAMLMSVIQDATGRQRATPLTAIDDPRRGELIDAVSEAVAALARYRTLADVTAWCAHVQPRSRSFAPTTV